jgi:hypothetical protein
MTVSWFGPQNQADFDLSVASQNRRREDDTIEFPSLTSRLAEARQRVVHVALSKRLRRDQVEDGRVDVTDCVGHCYSYFVVLYVLSPRSIIVF